MLERIRAHLGEIWAVSAVAVILSSVAAGMLLVSDQVVGCTGPVKLVSLEPVEEHGHIDLPDSVELKSAAWAQPTDPDLWAVATIPRRDLETLFDQEVFERVEEREIALRGSTWMVRLWEDRPEWVGPLPDQPGRYLFAEHTFREWEHMAEFVSVLAPLGDGTSDTVEIFIGVERVYSD